MIHPTSHNVESDLNIVNKQYNLNAPFQDGHYKRYTDIHIKKNTVIAFKQIFYKQTFPLFVTIVGILVL